MRRRELLGFELSWPGCYLSNQVIKKEERPKGANNMWEACNNGSSLAVSVDFLFYENISPNLYHHPPSPPPAQMASCLEKEDEIRRY